MIIYIYINSQLKNVTGTCHIGDLTLDGKAILKLIPKKGSVRKGSGNNLAHDEGQ
jgi:hypothetical protein